MAFEAHCIVEIMGHQVIAGKVSEETHFGAPLMRVDVPKSTKREEFTVYYGGGAIYKITPTTEEIVKAFVEKQDPEPVRPYMLALPTLAGKVEETEVYDPYDGNRSFFEDDPDQDDDDYGYDDDGYRRAGWDDDEPLAYAADDAPEYYEDGQPVDPSQPDVAGFPSKASVALSEKESAAKRAKELLAAPFVIFDTETSGLNAYSDEILSIGIIDQDGKVLLDTYIKPVKPITNSRFHGITDETVKDAPTFKEVYPQIVAALENKTVLSYNYQFDGSMIEGNCQQHDLNRPSGVKGECVMELYAQFYGEWNEYHSNYKWQKLTSAVSDLGLEFIGGPHNALNDAQMTLLVLKKMADWYDTQQVKANETSKEPG